MKIASLTKDIQFNDNKPAIQVLFETQSGKEIRIAFKDGQIMKEHKTPYPIVVEVHEGDIDFGVQGEIHRLRSGDLISLDGGVPHDLKANAQSIVRLSLNAADTVNRVENVVKDS